MPGTTVAAVDAEDPRRRVAQTSIRLVDPPNDAPTGDAPDRGERPDGPTGRVSAIPFRGRLDDGSDDAPVRHLRPVPGGRGEAPTGAPGGDRAIDGDPMEEAEGIPPPDDEENPHGPNPGGNR